MPLAALVLIGEIIAAQQRRVNDNALINADKSSEWLTYGRTYSEQRYSPYTLDTVPR